MTDADIQDGLKKLHEAMGHAPKEDMMRALRLGKARARALRLCRNFSCPECPRMIRPKLPRSVQPKKTKNFGDEVGLDLIEVTLLEGGKQTTQVSGLNMVDAHTGVQIVWPIKKPMSSVEAKDVLNAFELGWGSLTPEVKRFSADAGIHFEGIVTEFCKSMGVPLVPSGTEAHWQQGQV